MVAENTVDSGTRMGRTLMGISNVALALGTGAVATLDVILAEGSIALNVPIVVAGSAFGYEAFRNIRDKVVDRRGYVVAAAVLIPFGLVEAVSGVAELFQPHAGTSLETAKSLSLFLGIWKTANGLIALSYAGAFGPKAKEMYSAIGSRAAALLK